MMVLLSDEHAQLMQKFLFFIFFACAFTTKFVYVVWSAIWD